MNTVFAVIFIFSNLILLITAPESFLPTLLDGASKSATLCISLLSTYSVWLGLMEVWKKSGITQGISRLLKPVAKRIFLTEDKETLDAVCMNLSVNLLGISGAATPYGIKAAQLLDRSEHAEYSSAMLFVVNATSIQLIPTSIIGVRVALGSASPTDIVIPTMITTVFSTLFAMLLTRIFIPPKKAKQSALLRSGARKTGKAGI